jgi:all-trans-retinol 13,14-reductase
LNCIEKKFNGLKNSIQTYYVATPLTYRDYLGNDDGALYGIAKNYQEPLTTILSAKTKISNLYLTGQNLNLHGILGAAISGLITCFELLGNDNIIKKIKNA